jgi:hypothetical protein
LGNAVDQNAARNGLPVKKTFPATDSADPVDGSRLRFGHSLRSSGAVHSALLKTFGQVQ